MACRRPTDSSLVFSLLYFCLARLQNATRHLAWWATSMATISPLANLDSYFLSWSSVAYFLTLLSISMVEALCWSSSASSQNKHMFINVLPNWTSCFYRTWVAWIIFIVSFSFGNSSVLFTLFLHDLCQQASLALRVNSMPTPLSRPLKSKPKGL